MKRYLDVRYDVTDLTRDEVDQLALEAAVAGSLSERHPGVLVESEVVEHPDACSHCGRENEGSESGLCASCDQQARYERVSEDGKRTVLVHLNVEVPEADARDAEEIAQAVYGALEVGSDHESVRNLTVVMALSEEL
jgi:hypothetical protein